MRWSYADLLATPEPVVDELVRYMQDLAADEKRRAREAEREAARRKLRR